MHPDALGRAVVGNRRQRIDRARAARPGVGADRKRAEPRGTVVGHGACQEIHVQPKLRVARQQPDALRSHADDARRADVGAVALVAQVHGGAFGVPRRFARRHEGVDAGRRAAAGQQTAGAIGIAEPAAKPVDHHQLDLTRPARDQPGAGVDVVTRGQEIGQNPGPGRGGGDEPEAARVVQPDRERQDFARGLLDHLQRRPALLRGSGHQLVVEYLLELTVPGVFVRKILDALNQQFRCPAREIEHLLGCHREVIAELVDGSRLHNDAWWLTLPPPVNAAGGQSAVLPASGGVRRGRGRR